MKSIQELSTPALLVDGAHLNISPEDFGKSATITAKQSIIESHSRSEPIELQGLLQANWLHSRNTDQLGVVRFTPKIPLSKHM